MAGEVSAVLVMQCRRQSGQASGGPSVLLMRGAGGGWFQETYSPGSGYDGCYLVIASAGLPMPMCSGLSGRSSGEVV